MDQDSFRRLLQTPSATLPSTPTTKPKTIDASQPAFKPRKVKKAPTTGYRDRAAERRLGGGNDYAQIEAVLEEFEKKHADADKEDVEEKRKYLGGDSDHSILVKGLDMALLEANKAKAATFATEDDDVLEKAFADDEELIPEATATTKKRTREDLLRELKEKRGQTSNSNDSGTGKEEAKLLEEAKKAGKFKPIGFKPIAEDRPKKKKKVKGEVKEGERRKKKRKVEENSGEGPQSGSQYPAVSEPTAEPGSEPKTFMSEVKHSEPEPLSEDFNIFGDVGEYQALDLGDDEEDEHADDRAGRIEEGVPTAVPQQWVPMDEDDLPIGPSDHQRSPPPPHRKPCSPARGETLPAPEEEENQARLAPLASSALPSIKDFLALQEVAEAEDKRRKRKEKKKANANK